MKKMLLFAVAVSGLTLVGASPVPYSAPGDEAAYPPCSSTVTDRCIQLYERGVATEENLALNDDLGQNAPGPGLGGPYQAANGDDDDGESSAIREARTDYPPCSATVTDRCIQGTSSYRSAGYAKQHHKAAYAKKHHKAHKAKEMRLAMRAGERG